MKLFKYLSDKLDQLAINRMKKIQQREAELVRQVKAEIMGLKAEFSKHAIEATNAENIDKDRSDK